MVQTEHRNADNRPSYSILESFTVGFGRRVTLGFQEILPIEARFGL